MRRRIARFVFVVLLGTLAGMLGVVMALVLSPPGRDLLARSVSSELSRALNGSVQVGSVSGSFLYDLTIEGLVVRDTAGVLLADLPHVRVAYRLPNFLARRFVLARLQVERPTIQLIKHANGRMNYEDVLRLGGPGGGTSPLIEFRNLRVREGTLRLMVPWSPPPQLKTQAERDSVLAVERAKPGRVIESGPEGFRRVIEFSPITTTMARMRISTPDHRPFLVDLDTLATRVSDPQIVLRDAAGRVRLRGDSVVFSLRRGALPHTRFSGGGAVTWPHDTTLYDFQVVATEANLTDLRWISPNFPDFTGRGTVAAHSESGMRTAFVVTDLHLARGSTRIDGQLTALDDHRRGLGVRGLKLTHKDLDLDEVRPFVPDLPFFGTLSGSTTGAGFLDALDVKVEWDYTDEEVAGRPVTHVAAQGRVSITPKQGLAFRDLAVSESDVDLGTVRRLAPAIIVPGRLQATGTLNGPLRDVTFVGTAQHQDDDRPVSVIKGTVHLDTRRDTLRLDADVALEPLSFEGIRRAFPAVVSNGDLTGRVRLDGTLAHLAVDGSVSGAIGTVDAKGTIAVLPPRWEADDLRLEFRHLDLAALRATGPVTSLNGTLDVTGVTDTARAPEGRLTLTLGPGRVRDLPLDTLVARVAVHDSLITVDTLDGRLAKVTARGRGTLGWSRPHDGRMAFDIQTDSLGVFDSVLVAWTGLVRDTAADSRPLGGTARGTLTLGRSLDSLDMAGSFQGRSLAWSTLRAPAAIGAFTYVGGRRPVVTAAFGVDSLAMRARVFRRVGLQARGFADSLEWNGGVAIGNDVPSRLTGGGHWWRQGDQRLLAVESLDAHLATGSWRLKAPALLTLSDSAPGLTPLVLEETDGSGRITAAGRLPGDVSGALSLDAFGIDLRDVYGLIQRDTAGASGEIGFTLTLGGTAREPKAEGTAWLEDAIFGDFQAPFAHTIIKYDSRRLDAHAGIFRTGTEVLEVNADLPLDLGFTGVTRRKLDGPLTVRARADSADLGLLEAVLPGIRDVEGQFVAEAQVSGTWAHPQVSGFANVSRGAMTIPGIGVRYAAILARGELRGDSLLIPYGLVTSGGGTLEITGGLRFDSLSRPLLNLDLDASRFQALNIRNFLSLTATGKVHLGGPVLAAHASGSATVNQGFLYFADLLNKQIINLEDPTIADLVDTSLVRRANLGAAFQNRFLDSLTVDSLALTMGEGFFLRSTEANIQLAGQLVVSKLKREYRPVGTLEAVRGTYALKIGPVTRDFTVTQGTVRYFGTPDLNAELDITAQHIVRTVRTNEEIPVVARITGTLYAPKLALESPVRPPIPETDLASYLIFGSPAGDAVASGQINQSALQNVVAAFSSEVERFLISDLGVPIDYVEFQPGIATAGGAAVSRFAFGWRIGTRSFVTLNAGFCGGAAQSSSFGAQNFGATFEYRFSQAWRFQTSFEPTFSSCTVAGYNSYLSTSRYQIGADVFWEREF
jgi:translocation and assembly module TamB